jgi:AcrR family transcriptional regulator
MDENISSHRESSRDQILQAAHALFLQHGYNGTSMRAIARQAGIALGGIYNHFSSKEEIFIAILLERHPYFDLLAAMNAAEGDTAELLLRDAARRMVACLGERLDFLNLMFIELVEFRRQHIPLLFNLFFPQIMQFAERLNAHSETLRPVPYPVLMRAFLGLFFSYVMTELLLGQNLPKDANAAALDYFTDIFLHGILLEPAQTSASGAQQ